MSCQEEPYNITSLQGFYSYKNNNPTITDASINLWIKCIATNTGIPDIREYKKLINDNKTSEELNNYSMYIYNNDLNYTIGKLLFFIVLIITYIYFFKITGIVTPIMNLFEFIKNKITTELPKIQKKIENTVTTKK